MMSFTNATQGGATATADGS